MGKRKRKVSGELLAARVFARVAAVAQWCCECCQFCAGRSMPGTARASQAGPQSPFLGTGMGCGGLGSCRVTGALCGGEEAWGGGEWHPWVGFRPLCGNLGDPGTLSTLDMGHQGPQAPTMWGTKDPEHPGT